MLSYIGGKSTVGLWIREYIPLDIETYVETFSGMFWVFFKTDWTQYKNLKNIVYNDINPLNANLFRCVKNYKEFGDIIKDIPSQNSELFYQYQDELFKSDIKVGSEPDYELGYKYAYILTQVWSGTNPQKGKFINLKGKYKSKFDTFKDKILNPKWQVYFDMITNIESMDFEDIINKYDSDLSYFYCDPPYFRTEDYYANHDFGIETHKRLSDCLINMKGKFSLSYYDFTQLSEWFPKNEFRWEEKDFHKASMAKSGQKQTKGTEILIMNY